MTPAVISSFSNSVTHRLPTAHAVSSRRAESPARPWRRRTIALCLAGVFLALSGLTVLAVASSRAPIAAGPVACAFRSVTGQSCPFCGGTRAAVATLRGDVSGALMQPLGPLAVIALILAVPLGVVALRDPRRIARLVRRTVLSRPAVRALIVVIVVLWACRLAVGVV